MSNLLEPWLVYTWLWVLTPLGAAHARRKRSKAYAQHSHWASAASSNTRQQHAAGTPSSDTQQHPSASQRVRHACSPSGSPLAARQEYVSTRLQLFAGEYTRQLTTAGVLPFESIASDTRCFATPAVPSQRHAVPSSATTTTNAGAGADADMASFHPFLEVSIAPPAAPSATPLAGGLPGRRCGGTSSRCGGDGTTGALQLRFWHECRYSGCRDASCALCANNPKKRCNPGAELADCYAEQTPLKVWTVWMVWGDTELVDCYTELPPLAVGMVCVGGGQGRQRARPQLCAAKPHCATQRTRAQARCEADLFLELIAVGDAGLSPNQVHTTAADVTVCVSLQADDAPQPSDADAEAADGAEASPRDEELRDGGSSLAFAIVRLPVRTRPFGSAHSTSLAAAVCFLRAGGVSSAVVFYDLEPGCR
eukprot:356009-Chlamydomonas_euryale.AAC.5